MLTKSNVGHGSKLLKSLNITFFFFLLSPKVTSLHAQTLFCLLVDEEKMGKSIFVNVDSR